MERMECVKVTLRCGRKHGTLKSCVITSVAYQGDCDGLNPHEWV